MAGWQNWLLKFEFGAHGWFLIRFNGIVKPAV
jgi:hypothetical protein